MGLSSKDMCNKVLGENKMASIAKPQGNKETGNDDSQCEINITNLPGDCLNLIFKCLKKRRDRNSFSLTCHQWLQIHIQNNNDESLFVNPDKYSPEGNFLKTLRKLLGRFPHLKKLHVIFDENIMRHPEIANSVILQSKLSGPKIQELILDLWYENTVIEVCLGIFSLCPHLTRIHLLHFGITDEGLEALAKRCLLLETVELTCGRLITDSGIIFLLHNCRHLATLHLSSCDNITGIGFLGCPETLTHLTADYCNLTLEGISAIVSGGGLECLRLCRGVPKFKTETIMTISKGCPLLKELSLTDCEEVERGGWRAIGQNCKYLERLNVYDEEGAKRFVRWK